MSRSRQRDRHVRRGGRSAAEPVIKGPDHVEDTHAQNPARPELATPSYNCLKRLA